MQMIKMAAVAAMMALSGEVSAQTPAAAPPDFSKVEIKTTDLGDGVYMLEGQGGNITVAAAKDGIIMVDGEFAPLHDKIKAAMPFYGFPQGDGEPDYSGMTAKVWGHMADPDDYFTPADAKALEERLRKMGKDVTIEVHKAGHAFMNEENPGGTYDAALAEELWPKMISFFKEALA